MSERREQEEENTPSRRTETREIGIKFAKNRLFPLVFGILFINYAFLMWFIVGYLLISAIVAIWILLLLGIFLILNSLIIDIGSGLSRVMSLFGFFVALYILVLVANNFLPPYGTDELVTDTYAAYLFIHGQNPYINANMASEFTHYGYPSNLLTPLLSGGSVNYLIYPGLSVLLFVPAVLLGIRSYVILIAFNIISMLLLYYYYGKKNFREHTPILIIVMLFNLELLLFSVSGGTDIIWITFLGFSYVFRKKPYLSGVFYGLSIATKQIPAIIFPFYLYFLFRENGRNGRSILQFLGTAILSFFAVNAPFIYMNPYEWLLHVLSVANQPIIGVGIGFSILSFAGFLNVPAILFAVYMILAMMLLLVIYLTYYDSLKYTFFVFPMVIFLFNYRALENYIIYWIYMVFLLLPDLFGEYRILGVHHVRIPSFRSFIAAARETMQSQKKISWMLVIAIIITGMGVSVGYGYSYTEQATALKVTSVYNASDPLWVNGNISELTVNITYTPISGDPIKIPIQIRILTYSGTQLGNLNGRLWYAFPGVVKSGNNTVNIYPSYSNSLLPVNSSFKVQAFYGGLSATSLLKSFSISTDYPLQNPSMQLPSNDTSIPLPGWTFDSNIDTFAFATALNGVNLTLSFPDSFAGFKYADISTPINFTYLAENNFTMRFDLSIWNHSSFLNSTHNSTGLINFTGIRLSFDQGQQVYWLGYSASQAYWVLDSTHILNLTPDNVLNFSALMNELNVHKWTYDFAVLTFMIGTTSMSADASVNFQNVELLNSQGQQVGIA